MAPDRGTRTTKSTSSRVWEALTPSLSQWILDATATMGFARMTPVQASTIPLFMGHKDVVVEAVTGSGKTLAFLIPLVEKLLRLDEPIRRHHVGAIVISPTRELTQQIHQVLLSLLRFHEPSLAAVEALADTGDEQKTASRPLSALNIVPQLLLGGATTAAQDLSNFLKVSPNVLIGTPGRLLEILSSRHVHCPQSSFETLILDEADRLLDLGFKNDLTKIISLLPKQRRTGLFSASVSEAVDQIIRVGLRNPVRIAVKVKGLNGVDDKRTPASLQMTYLITPASHKFPAVGRLLQQLDPVPLRTIVYLSTCAAVDYFQLLLPALLPSGMTLVPLHGKHSAQVRQKNFVRFTNSALPTLLLTTDVAARGLDIPSVDLVVQVDPPSDPKAFLHRCGRAGRAGRKGLSVVLLQPGCEEDYVRFLEVRKTPIEKLIMPEVTVTEQDCCNATETFRQIVLKDRATHDKAQKAFVSWVRSYSKHQASSIFRLADLDWTDLAAAWGLLRCPKMPETKQWDRSTLRLPDVDWERYQYKDKQQETKRQNALVQSHSHEIKPATTETKKRPSTAAWSHKLDRREDRQAKRSRKEARREHERKEKMSDAERRRELDTEQMVQEIRQQQEQQDVVMNEPFEGFD